MSEPRNLGLGALGQRVRALGDPASEPHLHPHQTAPVPETPLPAAASQPARPAPPPAPKSVFNRAMGMVRSSLPIVHKLLPLLEGNVASAIGNLVLPQTQQPPAQPQINLEPIERGLAEVRTSNRELRYQMAEQTTNLKRVEDQLERVREATDRNTLEQQELVEDLRSVGSRVNLFALIGLVVLLVSLGLNIYLLLQLRHILR